MGSNSRISPLKDLTKSLQLLLSERDGIILSQTGYDPNVDVELRLLSKPIL